jgi:hypothetical protein
MVNPKLEYIEDLVRNSFSEDIKKTLTLNFKLNKNNVVVINVKYNTLTIIPSLWEVTIHRRIVEKLYSFGIRVNEDYKIETDISWISTLRQ